MTDPGRAGREGTRVSKTMLVTGGAGFIGSNFVRLSLSRSTRQYRMLVLDALTYAGSVTTCPDATAPEQRSLRVLVRRRPQRRAGRHPGRRSPTSWCTWPPSRTSRAPSSTTGSSSRPTCSARRRWRTRCTKHRDARRAVHPHLDVRGLRHGATRRRWTRSTRSSPMSPYAAAKCGADRLVYSYWATYDIPAVIVRPFNNYGPRQHLEKAVPRFITSCLLGEPLTRARRRLGGARLHLRRGPLRGAGPRCVHARRETVARARSSTSASGRARQRAGDRPTRSRELMNAATCRSSSSATGRARCSGTPVTRQGRASCSAGKPRTSLRRRPATARSSGIARTRPGGARRSGCGSIPIVTASGDAGAALMTRRVPFFQHDLGQAELDAIAEVLAGPILTTGETVDAVRAPLRRVPRLPARAGRDELHRRARTCRCSRWASARATRSSPRR